MKVARRWKGTEYDLGIKSFSFIYRSVILCSTFLSQSFHTNKLGRTRQLRARGDGTKNINK